jgi:hypothetical protein
MAGLPSSSSLPRSEAGGRIVGIPLQQPKLATKELVPADLSPCLCHSGNMEEVHLPEATKTRNVQNDQRQT